MNRFGRLFHSSIGCKVVMAMTGIALFLFVVGHLFGNLQVFQDPRVLNDYAEFLRTSPGVLWSARLGLIVVFAVHIYAAFRLHHANREARPTDYLHEAWLESTFPARHMLLSGLVVLAFVVFHLLHFTFTAFSTPRGAEMILLDAQGRHDVHAMLIQSFQVGWVAASYVVAVLLLGLHLLHGTASVFQTLGLRREALRGALTAAGVLVTILIVVGYLSIPICIYFGLVPAGTGG